MDFRKKDILFISTVLIYFLFYAHCMTSGLPAPATLFPHPVFRDNQCIPASAAISAIQSAPRQIRSASATISVTPVCAATNTVRLRNYFRNSVRAATNTFRLRDHFRNSVRSATNTFRLRNYFRNSVRAATNTFRLRDHFRNSAHKFSCSSEIIQHQLHTLFPNLLPYQHIPRTAVINHHTSPPFSPSLSSL